MKYLIDFYVLHVGNRFYSHQYLSDLTCQADTIEELIAIGDQWLSVEESHIDAKRYNIRKLEDNGTCKFLYWNGNKLKRGQE